MRVFLFIYTLLMIGGSLLTLSLIPRALKDVGQERQRLREELPEAEFEQMVEAGYRVNTFLVLVEILYYFLLLRYSGSVWQFLYGGFVFGVIHIFYLVVGRLEKRRLARGSTRTRPARFLLWLTAALTSLELLFLIWVSYLLLLPAD